MFHQAQKNNKWRMVVRGLSTDTDPERRPGAHVVEKHAVRDPGADLAGTRVVGVGPKSTPRAGRHVIGVEAGEDGLHRAERAGPVIQRAPGDIPQTRSASTGRNNRLGSMLVYASRALTGRRNGLTEIDSFHPPPPPAQTRSGRESSER